KRTPDAGTSGSVSTGHTRATAPRSQLSKFSEPGWGEEGAGGCGVGEGEGDGAGAGPGRGGVGDGIGAGPPPTKTWMEAGDPTNPAAAITVTSASAAASSPHVLSLLPRILTRP